MDNTTHIGALILIFLVFLCFPLHVQKTMIKAAITGGTTKTHTDGETITTARFGGYKIKPEPIVKHKLKDWQKMLIGGIIAIFISSLLMGVEPEGTYNAINY